MQRAMLSTSRTEEKTVPTSSVVVRIAAWYDWLLIILVLALGAYTCKCLDDGLTRGVQNALSIRAKEIGSMFAATGEIPASEGSTGPGLSNRFITVHQSGVSVPDSPGKRKGHTLDPRNVHREPDSLAVSTSVVPRTVHDGRFLMANARSTFGSKAYVVEVRTPKKPINALFRETAITMLIGLVVGLVLATFGSFWLVRRALVPVQKIALAVQALPVVHPDAPRKNVAVLEQIESLCVNMNEMAARLEDSFQIGVGLPPAAFHAADTELGIVRGELAKRFENERQSIGIEETLLCLLKETERLSDISRKLVTPSGEPPGKTRTARLRFYLGGLAVSAAEQVCGLTRQLGADLASAARNPANEDYSIQW
jgi:hypothetical protein